jgi:hypothetical protein
LYVLCYSFLELLHRLKPEIPMPDIYTFAVTKHPHPKAVLAGLQESKSLKKRSVANQDAAGKGDKSAHSRSSAVRTANFDAEQGPSVILEPKRVHTLADNSTSAPNYRSLYERLRSAQMDNKQNPDTASTSVQPAQTDTKPKPELDKNHGTKPPEINHFESLPLPVLEKVR